jgi:transcriptional regulator with AAA-type ATPase domain
MSGTANIAVTRCDPGAAVEPPALPHLFLVLDAARPLAGGGRFALDGVGEVWIGRGAALSAERREGGRRLDIQVPDILVSSRHARLTPVPAGTMWAVLDEGSRNGSFLDGARVSGRALVRDGSILELGTTVFCLRTSLPTPEGAPPDLLSASSSGMPGMATLLPEYGESLAALARVASSTVSVLLLGETGSGKELLARAVHVLSGRRGPLVPVNCGALADTLVESLLFGHTKGAFSGALRDEPGLVRSSHQGSLFLDEIGDMAPATQASLLRVLQEGEVVPVGSTRPVVVDLRVVAATHHRVDAATGDFRRDLYARLAGYTHEIPPVRARLEDLGLLLGDVLRKVSANPEAVRLQAGLVRAMLTYGWPLNVRELQHCLASAVVLAADAPLTLAHLPASVRAAVDRTTPRSRPHPARAITAEDERIQALLVASLEETRGNVSKVARALGRTRMQIHRWMNRFGIDVEKYRGV